LRTLAPSSSLEAREVYFVLFGPSTCRIFWRSSAHVITLKSSLIDLPWS
jgi:hypothetical protein